MAAGGVRVSVDFIILIRDHTLSSLGHGEQGDGGTCVVVSAGSSGGVQIHPVVATNLRYTTNCAGLNLGAMV